MARKNRPAAERPTATKTVQNPLWSRDHHGERSNPRFVQVAINPRESGIVTLAARGLLDQAQEAAADRFRALWETLGGAGAKAIDYSREAVDGGAAADPISLRQVAAGRSMAKAMQALKDQHGDYGCRIVVHIAGQGHSVHDLAETRRQRDTLTDNLRSCLDLLARHWGYAGGTSGRVG